MRTNDLGATIPDRSTPRNQSPPTNVATRIAKTITGGRLHLLTVALVIVGICSAWFIAFLLRFEFTFGNYGQFASSSVPFVLIIKLLVFYSTGVFRIVPAYLGLRDLVRLFAASMFASGLVATSNLCFLREFLIPRSVLLLDGLLSFVLVSSLFALLRTIRERSRAPAASFMLEPVLIIGAGDAGEGLLRDLQRSASASMRVVAFVDDAREKRGQIIRGIPVEGPIDRIPELAHKFNTKKAIIAIPSADGGTMRRIAEILTQSGLTIRVLPPIARQLAGHFHISHLRSISIDDLLRRAPVTLDDAAIRAFLQDRRVLVTGAAGSIGSELCRQIADYHPSRLLAVDSSETPLNDLILELRDRGIGNLLQPELADITHTTRIEGIFRNSRPEVVFHAAALKHVPMCEAYPLEALRVNLVGTRNVAELASEYRTKAFVMISTDKAVNPTSIMGASKRLAELLVQGMNNKKDTRFTSVRFGNVLGSNGSVVPIFRRQIAQGGPITVTHPDMTRFFMTIPEAVQLVLEATVVSTSVDILMLQMGRPIRIVDLAEDLIRLSGLVPNVDIKIEFTGIRAGEKLHEQLQLDNEASVPTSHPQVFGLRPLEPVDFESSSIERLLLLASAETNNVQLLSAMRAVSGLR